MQVTGDLTCESTLRSGENAEFEIDSLINGALSRCWVDVVVSCLLTGEGFGRRGSVLSVVA